MHTPSLAALALLFAAAPPAPPLSVEPAAFSLAGLEQSRQLVVTLRHKGRPADHTRSATYDASLAIASGLDPASFPDGLRDQVQRELKAWHVQTVIVGPMANQANMVAFITRVLARAPIQTGGVYAWEGLDPAH